MGRSRRTGRSSPAAGRPGEDYRTPTDSEWDAFLAHFDKRKVSVGTCARAFGSPCIHEHACVRCSLLRPDPASVTASRRSAPTCSTASRRLNTKAGSATWKSLQVSLAGAGDKLTQITALLRRTAGAV